MRDEIGGRLFEVKTPRQLVVHSTDSDQGLRAATAAGFTMPLLVKPIMAFDHDVELVTTGADFAALIADGKISAPLVLQECIPHEEALFKVYVMGDDVRVDVRETGDQAASTLGRPPPEDAFFRELARLLRARIGLDLFNVDLLRDARGQDGDGEDSFSIIDVNYFPGYYKTYGEGECERALVEYLGDRLAAASK